MSGRFFGFFTVRMGEFVLATRDADAELVDFLAEQLKELQLDHLAARVDLRRDKAILHIHDELARGRLSTNERAACRTGRGGRCARGFVQFGCFT